MPHTNTLQRLLVHKSSYNVLSLPQKKHTPVFKSRFCLSQPVCSHYACVPKASSWQPSYGESCQLHHKNDLLHYLLAESGAEAGVVVVVVVVSIMIIIILCHMSHMV